MPRNNEASSIKLTRRKKGEMEVIRQRIIDILEEDWPQTVRQVFYQLVSQGVIEKTEAQYQSTVIRLLTEMRLSHQIRYSQIEDNTRYMRRPNTFESLQDAVDATAEFYRRGMWTNQDHTVQVWLEKDALSGVVWDVTWDWDVPLYVTRGYPSLTFLHRAAVDIRANGRPTKIIYIGDHDPSGVDIERNIQDRLQTFDCEFEMMRLAVTPAQIKSLKLPSRPTKGGDTRIASFEGESTEVDAIPSKILKQMIRDEILKTLDQEKLKVIRAAEESEKEILCAFAARLENSDDDS